MANSAGNGNFDGRGRQHGSNSVGRKPARRFDEIVSIEASRTRCALTIGQTTTKRQRL
jgi:hypothetical protein